jgi:hypothetical protein
VFSDLLARAAARLRTATGKANEITATDAVVAAIAERTPDSVALTSAPNDFQALEAYCRPEP